MSVKMLHVGNGLEYTSFDFRVFCEQGIELKTITAPYTPQHDERAERDNRTIVESAMSMIYGAGVLQYLWAQAVGVYLLTNTPTFQTPSSSRSSCDPTENQSLNMSEPLEVKRSCLYQQKKSSRRLKVANTMDMKEVLKTTDCMITSPRNHCLRESNF